MSWARRAWCVRWRNSPCTGMKQSGRANENSVLSSSRLACPLTWTCGQPGMDHLRTQAGTARR